MTKIDQTDHCIAGHWISIRLGTEDTMDLLSYAHNVSSCEIKAWKNSGLSGIQTRDLYDTSTVLYQLSYQANWKLVTLWVCKI